MTGRRERLLEEMALGPRWRRRARSAGAPPAVAQPRSGYAAVSESGRPTDEPAALALDPRAARIAALDWAGLASAVAGCTDCPLHKTRTHTVFGAGDEQAEWMIVGEAPGAEEDARGEPFVGQAGRLLDSMLAALGLRREANVYIANVLKCRPPGNRNPEPFEVAQCTAYLLRQIALVRPRLILALGRFAAQTLLGTDASIASLRGRLFQYQGVPLVVSYHPAYLLRNLPDKAKAWEDLCFARAALAGLNESRAAPS